MKIVIIGEEIFCKKMKKLLSTLNLDSECLILDVSLDETSYEILLNYYETISSLLDNFTLEDKVMCLIDLDISFLDFENLPYIHLVYERKHEFLSLYFYELLFSRLILSYPEIWWVFIKTQGDESPYSKHTIDFYNKRKSLQEIILERVFLFSNLSPLFDLDDLYKYMLGKISKKHSDLKKNPDIEFFLIEEELDYIFYMFYALSQFQSTKVYPLHLYSLAKEVLNKNPCEHRESFFYYIHDRYYYPIDLPSEKNLDNLKARFKEFNLKKCSNVKHILVSFSDLQEDEKNFIDFFIKKPLSSISSFQDELRKKLGDNNLKKERFIYEVSEKGSHSSLGVLSTIASKILRRAERYYENIKSAEEAFSVAIMATYILKILGWQNLNLIYRAFSLKVKAEALGEVIFTGSDVNVEVKHKVEDIENFLTTLSKNFNLHNSPKIASMELLLLNELLKIYKEHNQLDEELNLTNYIREKVFKIRRKSNFLYNFIYFPFVKPLSSARAFISIAFVYIGIGMVLYWVSKNFKCESGLLCEIYKALISTVRCESGFLCETYRALISTVYGILSANADVEGTIFGVFIALANIVLVSGVIAYLLNYIFRR